MLRNFRFFSLILLVVATTVVASCATTKAKRHSEEISFSRYPKGYQNWTNTFSKIVLEKSSPFYGFQRVLVSKKAFSTYKKGGQYPEGSQLVLEFSEPLREDHEGEDIVKGSVNWIAVMTKDSSAIETGGWIYEAFDGNPIVAIKKDIDPVTECYNCHTAMKQKDYVFSSLQK